MLRGAADARGAEDAHRAAAPVRRARTSSMRHARAARSSASASARLERRPGQREERYTHLLGGGGEEPEEAPPSRRRRRRAARAAARAGSRRRSPSGVERSSAQLAELRAEISGAPRTSSAPNFRAQNTDGQVSMPAAEIRRAGHGCHPAVTAVEPSTRFAARVAAAIFAGRGLILLAVALLPARTARRRAARDPAVCGPSRLLLFLLRRAAGRRRSRLPSRSARCSCRCTRGRRTTSRPLRRDALPLARALRRLLLPPAPRPRSSAHVGGYLVVLLGTAPADAVRRGMVHPRRHPVPGGRCSCARCATA